MSHFMACSFPLRRPAYGKPGMTWGGSGFVQVVVSMARPGQLRRDRVMQRGADSMPRGMYV